MTTLADRFEERIEHNELPPPIARWRVLVKCTGIWALFVLASLLGASSVAVAVWFATDPDGLITELRESSFLYTLVTGLPLVWIFVGCVAICLAIWFFLHTPHGYRYRITIIAASVLLGVVCLGVSLMVAGLAESLEIVASYVPGYARIAAPSSAKLMRPDAGMVLGKIESMATGTWEIRDPNDALWTVVIVTTTQLPPHAKGQRQMIVGGCARIQGDVSSSNHIVQAEYIRPCPRGLHVQPVVR